MILTILNIIRSVLALVQTITLWLRERFLVTLGRKEAETDALKAEKKSEEEADRINEETFSIHEKDATDGAFLSEYKRDE